MKRILFLLLAPCSLLLASASAQIAPHVVRTKTAGVDLLVYQTGVKNVVTLRGSLPAGDTFAGTGNLAVPTLTGMLLDKGTTTENKFAIAQKLESVGASISFSTGKQMVDINARCLAKDVPLVIALIAEQLRTPALSAEELAKAKKQFTGGLRRQQEDTNFRADNSFARAAYPAGHPNYEAPPDEMLAAINSATLDEVKAFHAKYFGPAHLTLVAVGDVDAAQLQAEVGQSFAGWTGGVAVPTAAKATATDAAQDQNVFMADKTSVSVVIGQTTGLKYSDPDYQALRVATAVLGGSGFSGRLMQTVRDKDGLTYGIYSRTGNDTYTDGDWRIVATFAPALLDKGLASTRTQLNNWYNTGITPAELDYRKTNLVGGYKVGLATTRGLATEILDTVHRGYDMSWLDQYPQVIDSLTLDQVNGLIKKHLHPDQMIVIKAGTIPGALPDAK